MIDFDDLETSESNWREADAEFRALRCHAERAREPICRAKSGVGAAPAGGGETTPGVFYGLRLPRSLGELLEWGPEWLSKAFHAAGTIPPDAEVTVIRSAQSLAVGATASWTLLKVEFRPICGALHTSLLVKLPARASIWRLDEGGGGVVPGSAVAAGSLALQHSAEAEFMEVNAYRLLEGGCPFIMPRYYFGDVSGCGGSFLLVTQWIGTADDSTLVRAYPARSLQSRSCRLENFHGNYLAARNDVRGTVFVTDAEMDKAHWSLLPVAGENRRYFLQAWTDQCLAVSGSGEQDYRTSVTKGEREKWLLVPVLCEPNTFYLKSCYGTHLASLRDNENTLYMSPNMQDWEKWKRVPNDPPSDDDEQLGHLDLREASLELCDALVRRGAALAGLHKSGQLGPPDAIDRAFGASELKYSLPGPEPAGASSGLGQDLAFVDQAMVAQEFVHTVGKHLFPEHVTSAATMKAFRALLVTAKQNPEIIEWWCNFRKDYVALGPDAPALYDSFVSCDSAGDPALGLSSWAHVSVGSLGWKIWGWLNSADHRVLEQNLDPLLWQFIMTYQQSGGPYLDLELLRAHFFLAVLASTVGLLEALPVMYRRCPREEWASIVCLGDPRLTRCMPDGSWLWQHVQRFINVVVIIEKYGLQVWMEKMAPKIFSEYAIGGLQGESFKGCLVKASAADVFAEPSQQSSLLGRIRSGLLSMAVTESAEGAWVRVVSPLPGWMRSEDLEPVCDPVPRTVSEDPDHWWIGLMYHTRRQFTGYSPRHRCFTSTRMLIDELYLRDKHEKLLQRLGHGKPRSRMGSFLAEQKRRPWWPEGYQSWAHHTFLIFEDGTVADITADQWDPHVPQVWWPADARRYRTATKEADAARATRRDFGIPRWREMDLADDMAGVTRTRQRWLEIERSHGETTGRP